ncbi:polysaccharide deacetylase family protein [Sporolactobacillus putidus]|uniref:Polysaccharide deacetylase YxkH n=1 Tax=Sporolactobacillus putidus TaxID=492735 RepID=A0A917S2W4_9BACL|nr:polysaccharide deacetylase family protein [Sporolactobacillus putidus]GGL51698.1 putative polysaccharide deacetylase YxkH [Sporolactobacillus putidus]
MAHKINHFLLLICFLPALAGCFNTTVDTRPIKNPDDQRAEKPSVAVIHEETAALRANEINTSHWIHLNRPARIPILMYHSISKGNNSLHVPEQDFQAEMKWIKDHGYVTLTPAEAYLVLTRDIKPGKKCVLITLDDGYRDSYRTAYPIFRKYGLHATIFMIGKKIGAHNHLTISEMMEMTKHGISIQSHTINHQDLTLLSPGRQKAEMALSKALFDQMFTQETLSLSYPFGRYDSETLKLARETGYKMAVTTKPGAASRIQGMFALHRIRISPGISLTRFGTLLDRANQ